MATSTLDMDIPDRMDIRSGTIDVGSVLITSGAIRILSGLIGITSGKVNVLSGKITITSGGAVIGGVGVRSGQISITSGNVHIQSGSITLGSGAQGIGHVAVNSGKINVASGLIGVTSGKVSILSGEIHVVSGQIIGKTSGEVLKVQAPSAILADYVEVNSQSGGLVLASAPIVHVKVENVATSGDMWIGPPGILSGDGYRLEIGKTVPMDVDNLNKVYVFAEMSGDYVSYLAEVE